DPVPRRAANSGSQKDNQIRLHLRSFSQHRQRRAATSAMQRLAWVGVLNAAVVGGNPIPSIIILPKSHRRNRTLRQSDGGGPSKDRPTVRAPERYARQGSRRRRGPRDALKSDFHKAASNRKRKRESVARAFH